MDCSNGESAHQSTASVKKILLQRKETMRERRETEVTRKSVMSVRSVTKAVGQKSLGRLVDVLRSPEQNANTAGLLEPLIVEYFSLEKCIAKTSLWDRFPTCVERMRQFGYNNTRAKVEALWAFVEAHEKVLEESPVIVMFPDLVKCLARVVQEARDDLQILRDLQPRRFFYSKHLLVLRVIMHRRLQKLRKCTTEGWISQNDGERLVEDIQERIVQADQYFPRLSTRYLTSNQPAQEEHDDDEDQFNAWRDFTLEDEGYSTRLSNKTPADANSVRERLTRMTMMMTGRNNKSDIKKDSVRSGGRESEMSTGTRAGGQSWMMSAFASIRTAASSSARQDGTALSENTPVSAIVPASTHVSSHLAPNRLEPNIPKPKNQASAPAAPEGPPGTVRVVDLP
eukprot:gnl/TRDRNA2_/TRDRNA2_138303_c2_seq1.p1 gnl/TRDRNA2_/TRDRNA2_138303_c2~~gnl/TRDRNA2_/TRDRNA2_138303_c2_seq1.p1  ORF type:complete len:446 (+),score=74.71 gnl/TRDRNA2_/TRDRNA2_138303_c2_seq1:146-1339(+)